MLLPHELQYCLFIWVAAWNDKPHHNLTQPSHYPILPLHHVYVTQTKTALLASRGMMIQIDIFLHSIFFPRCITTELIRPPPNPPHAFYSLPQGQTDVKPNFNSD